MSNNLKHYINGAWVDPVKPGTIDVINPATEEAYTKIAAGSAADVDRAVAAARTAFATFSQFTKAQRLDLLRKVAAAYEKRIADLAKAVSEEMGAPIKLARESHAQTGIAHLKSTIKALEAMEMEEQRGTTRIVREGIGVVGLITPWNWPLNQIAVKVGPALAAGCTMVLKPSEVAPITGIIFSEIMHDSGVPAGVYNMVSGDGPSVGQVMAAHPGIDMMSFTGSTRAGIIVAKTAADTVKRVAQELGGKSPNLILRSADLEAAVTGGVNACFANSGQSCDAPTRMYVPKEWHDKALAIAKKAAEAHVTGDPRDDKTQLGPVVSDVQYNKIQKLIEAGIKEGATLVTGGPGRPEGLNHGYYIRPTIFGNVTQDMTVSREEIFGPVLSIQSYDNDEDMVEMANDTLYGLAAYISAADMDHARKIAAQLRAGTVNLNYPDWDTSASFGGYKQSGNGREYADFGIHDFLEIKSIVGYGAA